MELKNMKTDDFVACLFPMVGINCFRDDLLRRLNEADALRKENEELKEKIFFLARTLRTYANDALQFYEKHSLKRETDETRAANTIKESEARHD